MDALGFPITGEEVSERDERTSVQPQIGNASEGTGRRTSCRFLHLRIQQPQARSTLTCNTTSLGGYTRTS